MDLVWEFCKARMAVADFSMWSSWSERKFWMKESLPIVWPKKRVPSVISATKGSAVLRKSNAFCRWVRFALEKVGRGLVPLVEDKILVLVLLRWMPLGLPRVSNSSRNGSKSSCKRQMDVSSMTLAV